MKGTIGIVVILTLVVIYADALKCYVGDTANKVEFQCTGTNSSCVTVTTTTGGVKSVAFTCYPMSMATGCKTEGNIESCYCNTDLCNNGGGANPTKPTPPKPSGASVLSALKTTWIVAVSGIIAKLCLR